VLSTRSLIVQAVAPAGGSTGVRADAEVVWITPRPRSERIPAAQRLLRVTVWRWMTGEPESVAVTSRRRIRRGVRLLNALPAAQPGPRSCASEGVVVRLAFHARRGRPADALAAIDPAACLDISLTLHGRPQPPLATTRPLIRRLARALGLRPGFFTRTRAG